MDRPTECSLLLGRSIPEIYPCAATLDAYKMSIPLGQSAGCEWTDVILLFLGNECKKDKSHRKLTLSPVGSPLTFSLGLIIVIWVQKIQCRIGYVFSFVCVCVCVCVRACVCVCVCVHACRAIM